MITLGEVQELKVVKLVDFGVFLNEDEDDEDYSILLPKKYVPEGTEIGSAIDVFVYRDSEDRLIATTIKPLLTMGEATFLEVVDVTDIGAFLNWGLDKDLFLPFKEQTKTLKKGDTCFVVLYLDKSERLSATMKVSKRRTATAPYKVNDDVVGTVYEVVPGTWAGVAIDDRFDAFIPQKEFYAELKCGDRIEGRVSEIKENGKIGISLRKKAHLQMDDDSKLLLEKLEAAGGGLPYNDNTDPEIIKEKFKMSKRAFKRATGRLLKEGRIELTDSGMKLKV